MAFRAVKLGHDIERAVEPRFDAALVDGIVVDAVGRFEFCDAADNPIIRMVVFANRTFRVGSAGCPMSRAALAAVARAHSLVTRLALEDHR